MRFPPVFKIHVARHIILFTVIVCCMTIIIHNHYRKQIGMLRDDDEFIYQDVYDCDEFFTMLQAVMDYSSELLCYVT